MGGLLHKDIVHNGEILAVQRERKPEMPRQVTTEKVRTQQILRAKKKSGVGVSPERTISHRE